MTTFIKAKLNYTFYIKQRKYYVESLINELWRYGLCHVWRHKNKGWEEWEWKETDLDVLLWRHTWLFPYLHELLINVVSRKSAMWRHKNEGLSVSFLGVLFPTSPFTSLIFMTSHNWFLRHFVPLEAFYLRIDLNIWLN